MRLLNNEKSRYPDGLVIRPLPAGHSMHFKLHMLVGSTVTTAGQPKTTGLRNKRDKRYDVFNIK